MSGTKDEFGRRVCDVTCPAYAGGYCYARMDYPGAPDSRGIGRMLCKIPFPYRLCKDEGD